MTEPIIQVENLGKRYRIGVQEAPADTWQGMVKDLVGASFRYLRQMSRPPTEAETLWALRGVSFEMHQGEVLGVIGRNGAGKSTMLKILSRITDPTEGRAVINGRVGSLLEVGTGFHPELTGRENIYLNGAILGMKRREIERKFDEIVDFAEIDKFIDTPVKRYSSGMHVRLAFAVAAHLEPEILIVDEVLAVGDANFQRKCLGKMEGVASEGRTIIFVSHNMQAVARLCNRVITLNEGTILYEGDPTEAISKYFAGIHSTAEKNWDNDPGSAPGDEKVRLAGVRVRQLDSDRPRELLEYRQPICIEIDYDILGPIENLTASIDLVNGDSVTLFGSGDQHTDYIQRPPGRYRSTCLVPAYLLAEATYFVRVALLESSTAIIKHVSVRDILAFQVVDTLHVGAVTVRNHPGVIKPKLEWQLTQLTQSARSNGFASPNDLPSVPSEIEGVPQK